MTQEPASREPVQSLPITIRRAETVDDYRACQEAQREAWGLTEDGYLIPVATMVGANLHGGLVLGAFLADGRAAAMSFAFLGKVDDRLCLYSQLTGVVPRFQSRGLGYDLKLAQRDFARAAGLTLIAWAFDPLQAGNARFNLNKLGARVRRYVDNMYGLRTDALNAGVPTDRLIAEWEIGGDTDREDRFAPEEIHPLSRMIATSPQPNGMLEPSYRTTELSHPRLLLELPSDIAVLRRRNPDLAEAWRSTVRRAFRAAFAAGYAATGLLSESVPDGGRRDSYVLDRLA